MLGVCMCVCVCVCVCCAGLLWYQMCCRASHSHIVAQVSRCPGDEHLHRWRHPGDMHRIFFFARIPGATASIVSGMPRVFPFRYVLMFGRCVMCKSVSSPGKGRIPALRLRHPALRLPLPALRLRLPALLLRHPALRLRHPPLQL